MGCFWHLAGYFKEEQWRIHVRAESCLGEIIEIGTFFITQVLCQTLRSALYTFQTSWARAAACSTEIFRSSQESEKCLKITSLLFKPDDALLATPRYSSGDVGLLPNTLLPVTCTDEYFGGWLADTSCVLPVLPRARAGSSLFHLFLEAGSSIWLALGAVKKELNSGCFPEEEEAVLCSQCSLWLKLSLAVINAFK